ncbi:MAG: cytochrome c [Acidobacteriota bacterium]|nr:cytochrome c [Acidobacteriota bacterium]
MSFLLLALLTLTPSQERGRQIYFHGQSTSGRAITATIGEGGTPFAAAIVPCANCHGEDGRGRAEANVRPADITPEALARANTINGRTRAAYTRSHLKRAIGMGFDSARNPLNTAMPRYALSQNDANDLLDFLAILGSESQPGITDDTIRIGIIGDDTLTAPETRIYGRRIELVHDHSPDVFLRIDATSNTVPRDNVPTLFVRSLTASVEEQRNAMLRYAANSGIELTLAPDCEFRGAGSYVFLTSDVASHCDLAKVPLDRRVIVAVSPPPTASVLEMVTTLAGSLGRDLTRSALTDLLERQKTRPHVWLMTLDTSSRLVPLN